MAYALDKASLTVVCNDWVMLRAYHSSRLVVPRLIKSTKTYDRLHHAGSVDRLDICRWWTHVTVNPFRNSFCGYPAFSLSLEMMPGAVQYLNREGGYHSVARHSCVLIHYLCSRVDLVERNLLQRTNSLVPRLFNVSGESLQKLFCTSHLLFLKDDNWFRLLLRVNDWEDDLTLMNMSLSLSNMLGQQRGWPQTDIANKTSA